MATGDPQTRLLALDCGASFGYAHGLVHGNGGMPFSGVHKLPKDAPVTKRMIALETWLVGLIQTHEITHVYIERPILPKMTSFDAVTAIIGYALQSGVSATKCGCFCALIDIQSWRSAIGVPTRAPKNLMADPHYAQKFGHRKGGGFKEASRQYVKDRTRDFVVKQGCDPVDDNEADACAIWYAAKQEILARIEAPKYDLFADLKV